jgi:hypothetical protein
VKSAVQKNWLMRPSEDDEPDHDAMPPERKLPRSNRALDIKEEKNSFQWILSRQCEKNCTGPVMNGSVPSTGRGVGRLGIQNISKPCVLAVWKMQDVEP